MSQSFKRRVDNYNFPFSVDGSSVLGVGDSLVVDAPDGPGRIEQLFFELVSPIPVFSDNEIVVIIDGITIYDDVISNFVGVYGVTGVKGPYGSCLSSGGHLQYQLCRDLDYEVSAQISVINNFSNSIVIGNDDILGPNTWGGNTFGLQQFTALESSDVIAIQIDAADAGNVMLALYDDNVGEPGDVLTSCASTAVVVGWATIPVPACPIVAGTKYWLAFNSDGHIIKYITSTGKVVRSKAAVYGGFVFPDDPAGLASSTISNTQIAGIGGTVFNLGIGGRIGR